MSQQHLGIRGCTTVNICLSDPPGVIDVIPHRLGVTAQKYPVHVVTFFVSSFFVQSQNYFDNVKQEVKGFFALLGRFWANSTEQIEKITVGDDGEPIGVSFMPLDIAHETKHSEVVKLLVAAGATREVETETTQRFSRAT